MGLWKAFLSWLRSLFFKQEMELSLIGLQNAGKTSLVNVIATGGYSEDMIPTVKEVLLPWGGLRRGFWRWRASSFNRGTSVKAPISGTAHRSFWTLIDWRIDCDPTTNYDNCFSTLPFLFSVRRALISMVARLLLLLGSMEEPRRQVGFNMRKVTRGNVTIKLWDLGGQPRFRSMWERYCRGVSAIVYVVDAADRDNVSISRSELHDLLSKPSLNGIPLLVLGNKIDKQPEALSKQALIDQMNLSSLTDREVCCYMISCKNSTNIDVVIDWLVKHSKTKS